MNETTNRPAVSPNTQTVKFGHLVIHKGCEVIAEWEGGTFEMSLSNQAHSEELQHAAEITTAVKTAVVDGLKELGDYFSEKERAAAEARAAAHKAETDAHNKWADEENAARIADWKEELADFERQLKEHRDAVAVWLQTAEEKRGSRPTFFASRPARPYLVEKRF